MRYSETWVFNLSRQSSVALIGRSSLAFGRWPTNSYYLISPQLLQSSAAVPAAVVRASRPHSRGRDALGTAGKMPALLQSWRGRCQRQALFRHLQARSVRRGWRLVRVVAVPHRAYFHLPCACQLAGRAALLLHIGLHHLGRDSGRQWPCSPPSTRLQPPFPDFFAASTPTNQPLSLYFGFPFTVFAFSMLLMV